MKHASSIQAIPHGEVASPITCLDHPQATNAFGQPLDRSQPSSSFRGFPQQPALQPSSASFDVSSSASFPSDHAIVVKQLPCIFGLIAHMHQGPGAWQQHSSAGLALACYSCQDDNNQPIEACFQGDGGLSSWQPQFAPDVLLGDLAVNTSWHVKSVRRQCHSTLSSLMLASQSSAFAIESWRSQMH